MKIPDKAKKLVVIYVPPGAGHLVSTVELGKILTAHGLEVAVAIAGQADDNGPLLAGVEGTNPLMSFHRLPLSRVAVDVPKDDHVAMIFELARASNPDLRDFLRSSSAAVLVVDFFCGSALDVGVELGIPTYFFFTPCIRTLAFNLYGPVIHEKMKTLSFRDLGADLVQCPGLPPIPADHVPAAIFDQNSLSFKLFLGLSEQLCNSQGVIVNSFRSLEPRATDAIVSGLCTPPGSRTPQLYCIGPLIKSMEVGVGEERSDYHAWLDSQPKASVVFLCFGSMGRFCAEQTKQLARGLEMSGQRFLWVVRRPLPGPGDDGLDLDTLFPEGFLHRTKDRGVVTTSWAPQREVLAHDAVGGFVTHCGWNSVLEAIAVGMPMLAWPLYAEQRMNKVFLVEEMQVAVPMEGYDKEMVEAEEVSKKVRWLMESDGGRELRQRTRAAMWLAEEALGDGGESKAELLRLVTRWKNAD